MTIAADTIAITTAVTISRPAIALSLSAIALCGSAIAAAVVAWGFIYKGTALVATLATDRFAEAAATVATAAF